CAFFLCLSLQSLCNVLPHLLHTLHLVLISENMFVCHCSMILVHVDHVDAHGHCKFIHKRKHERKPVLCHRSSHGDQSTHTLFERAGIRKLICRFSRCNPLIVSCFPERDVVGWPDPVAHSIKTSCRRCIICRGADDHRIALH